MTPWRPIRARAPWPERAAVGLEAAGRPGRLPWRALSLGWRRANRPVPSARAPVATPPRDAMTRFALSIAYRWDVSLRMIEAANAKRPVAREAYASRIRSDAAPLVWSRPSHVSSRRTPPARGHGMAHTAVVPKAGIARLMPRLYHRHYAIATPRRQQPAHPDPDRIPLAATARANPPSRLAWRSDVVAPPRRAVHLSWRGASPPRDATASAVARPSPPARPPLHFAASPATAANALSPPTLSRAAESLDPAIAERLVDDVIRRVDRRMRIARERRGL